MEKLVLSSVSKNFGDVAALKPVSLTVSAGEFLTLLGPSGSGKTTLLQVLAGLLTPDTGEIWIDGISATNLPPHKRDIGLVFQNYALFPHLTVAENIAFPLKMRKLPRTEIDARILRILAIVGLPGVGDRLPRELSGGQQQRIAFARCAVYEPSVILMDEPLGALDKRLRDQMQIEVKRLHRELGATIVYVTHDQEEAMALSDRICLMNAGAIEQIGTPDNLYFRPQSLFAAEFFGAPNILDGEVRAVAEGEVHVAVAGEVVRACSEDHGTSVGDKVILVLRPEVLRILGPGEASVNTLPATFASATVTGPLTQYRLIGPNGIGLTSLALTTQAALRRIAGETLRIGWGPEDAVLLASRGARGGTGG